MKLNLDIIKDKIQNTVNKDERLNSLLSNLTDKNKSVNLLTNYIIYRTIIDSLSSELSERIKLVESLSDSIYSIEMNKLLIQIKSLNVLEPELEYREFNSLLSSLNKVRNKLIESNKISIISKLNVNKVLGVKVVEMADRKYGSIPISDSIKWNYNRIFLLEKVVSYKLYLILEFVYSNSIKDLTSKSFSRELDELKFSVDKLYRNKLIVFKEKTVEFKLPESMNYSLISYKEISKEDFISPIKFLIETGYYNADNITDKLIISLYKLDALNLIINIPKMKDRIKWVLRNY